MDADLFTQTPAAAAGDLARLATTTSEAAAPDVPHGRPPAPGEGGAVLATWHQLLDDGALQIAEPHLAGTARPVVARVSQAMARRLDVLGVDGGTVTVSTERGSITLPVEVADLPEGVVWLPANSAGSKLRATLGAGHGAVVSIAAGGEQ
jgi:NADH-quinone oxidoreductase subunit G